MAAGISLSSPADAGAGKATDRSAKRLTLAVIGDVPYGTEQEASFSELIGAVNDDPKVRITAHVGDIKSGSTTCSDERFAAVTGAFATFEDPVVYTPGDNEWTDCHRANSGSYDPLERLDALRDVFFADPGSTLRRRNMRVDAQQSLPENAAWQESRVVFATLHVVGSNNGLAPWSGLGQRTPTPEQLAEVEARTAATPCLDRRHLRPGRRVREPRCGARHAGDTWDPTPTSAQQSIA